MLIEYFAGFIGFLAFSINNFYEAKDIDYITFVAWCQAKLFKGIGSNPSGRKGFPELSHNLKERAATRDIRMLF